MTAENTLKLQHVPFQTDDGIASRARIGLVVLASDHTIEHEFKALLNLPGVACYQARIANSPTVTPTTLAAMGERISACADTLLPGVSLDVVAYGCTSATTVLGEDKVFGYLAQSRPQAKPTTPITAAFAAFDALQARRIAVLTPYTSDVNETLRAYITARGFEVPVFASFDEPSDNVVANISQESIRNAVRSIGQRDDVDMVFTSCTSLRLAHVIEDLENELGKPVSSSNHAMAWHCLRLAGVADRPRGFGRLYTL